MMSFLGPVVSAGRELMGTLSSEELSVISFMFVRSLTEPAEGLGGGSSTLMLVIVILNDKTESGGITPGLPLLPYPDAGGITTK